MFRTAAGSSASVATEAMHQAKQMVRDCNLPDGTDWEALVTPVGSANAECAATQSGVARSVLFLGGVHKQCQSAQTRGVDYPFVFGENRSNGLLAALGFVLDNAAIALYALGVGVEECRATSRPGGKVYSVFRFIEVLDECLLTSDRNRTFRLYVDGCAHASRVGGSLHDTARRLVHSAYLEGATAGRLKLSVTLAHEVRDACTKFQSNTRVGRLVLRLIQLLHEDAVTKTEACTPSFDKESWEKLHMAASSLAVPGGVEFR